ncbi:MAG: hypothetical protein ACI9UK_001218 [Candidatus Krumholzibacteriia bacterium]
MSVPAFQSRRKTYCNWRTEGLLSAFLLLTLVVVTPVFAQEYLFEHLFDPAGVVGDDFGNSMTNIPDVNGDGMDEFLVGIAGSDSSGLDAGQVFMWFGGSEVTRAPDRIWNGTSPEIFGWSVADIGDVNNDGTGDWAVGAPLSNAGGAESGRVCIFYGGANPSANPDVVIMGATGGDQFGFSVSAAGDFDGDGNDDFIVGAPYNDARAGNAGAAYVIYGGTGGPSTNLNDATVLAGEAFEDYFGWSVTDAGNFLGGNEDCVAVGAPGSNTHGGSDAGAVYAFEGKLGGAAPDTTIDFVAGISSNSKASSQLGFSVRGVGRLDNDSIDDLAVGAPFCNEGGQEKGRVEFFYGALNPAVVADHAVEGGLANGRFGWSLDRAGDVSGSTRDDVLIGAPFFDAIATDGGRAYIYEGGSSASVASGLVAIPNVPFKPGTEANDLFGWSVSSAGDFDGDGLPDYAVAAPKGNIGSNTTAGFATFYHSSGGPVPALVRSWKAQWRDAAVVQLAFDLSIPAEDVLDVRLTRRLHDAAGTPLSESLIWVGSPSQATDDVVGKLVRHGEGFAYLDDTSSLGVVSKISYNIDLVTGNGEVLRIENMSGPGERVIAPRAVLAVQPAWPNPANPAVTIRFRASADQVTTVTILDVRGRVVRQLHSGVGANDWQNVLWNGLTDDGQAAASGVYLIRVASGVELATQRVVLAR